MLVSRLVNIFRSLAGLQRDTSTRPSDISICDYYTSTIFTENTANNQVSFITIVVNTLIAGSYTKPVISGFSWPDVQVPGIIASGSVNSETVNLLPYFNGGLASANRNGQAVAVDFLDGGGPGLLTNGQPANDTYSNQYTFITHMYQFFGTILGCSTQGQDNQRFPSYQGVASQYEVHKYMALDDSQVFYFILQTELALQSVGVSQEDVVSVASLLDNTFNRRCAPNTTVVPSAGAVQQAICIDNGCGEAEQPVCSAYSPAIKPGIANSALAQGQGNASNPATVTFAGATDATSVSVSESGSIPTGSFSLTTSSIASDLVASATATATASAASQPSGIPNSTKTGIGVGVGVGGAVLLVAILTFCIHRHKKRAKISEEKAHQKSKDPGIGFDHTEPGVAVE